MLLYWLQHLFAKVTAFGRVAPRYVLNFPQNEESYDNFLVICILP